MNFMGSLLALGDPTTPSSSIANPVTFASGRATRFICLVEEEAEMRIFGIFSGSRFRHRSVGLWRPRD